MGESLTYAEIKDKSLAIVCTGCARRVHLHESYWNGLAKRCGGDVERMQARLKCEACGSPGMIEVREPEPQRVYSEHDREVLGLIGALMRRERRAKKRGEVPC